jgi:ferredoxin--NADP+ reductase
MPVSVAIVGAGPAGFYTAEALLQGDSDVAIDIIERLPTPFGLIRAGVAPDHQSTKQVTRKYESIAEDPRIRFYGNVTLGETIGLSELEGIYDAVVLAIGCMGDRPLGIPGDGMDGVYGSAAFVSWYNGHPDFHDLDPDLTSPAAVVIGNGNVALDVARVLVRTRAELARTDIADHAAQRILASAITDVYVVGRRGPLDAKFTNVELREIGRLEACTPIVDADQLPAESFDGGDDRNRRIREKNLATLQEFAALPGPPKPKRIHFVFYSAPVAVLGEGRVQAIRFERMVVRDGRIAGTGQYFEIACGLVVAAIGYRSLPIDGMPFDADRGLVPSRDGRVRPGLYTVGWAKRGPTGVIASNRPDGVKCAEQIREDIRQGAKPGRAALENLLASRHVRFVSFADWRAIDAAEIAAAIRPAPRRKRTTVDALMAAIDESRRNRTNR